MEETHQLRHISQNSILVLLSSEMKDLIWLEAQWFANRSENVPIYCFMRAGVRPLVEAYRALIDLLHLDCIILVDGGTDSLMRGNDSYIVQIVFDFSARGRKRIRNSC